MNPYHKLESKSHPGVTLKVIPGHFVTPHSHINSYIDMTTMKARQSEARACAKALAKGYARGMTIDTIVCMDNTEVIGAYLADEITAIGTVTNNLHQTIYVTTPEYDAYGQMIFRDNARMMLPSASAKPFKSWSMSLVFVLPWVNRCNSVHGRVMAT